MAVYDTAAFLKLIKSYLRSSMGEERLNNLAILSMENDVAHSLNYADVIDSLLCCCQVPQSAAMNGLNLGAPVVDNGHGQRDSLNLETRRRHETMISFVHCVTK